LSNQTGKPSVLEKVVPEGINFVRLISNSIKKELYGVLVIWQQQ
jgi:hypothetical protein